MEKAYLNVLLKANGEGLSIVKAHIRRRPSGQLGADSKDCFWATVFEVEGATFEEAQLRTEFFLDRADYRQMAGLMLLKKAVERDLGRPIGDGTIQELLPPGTGPFAKLFARGDEEPDRGGLTGP